jgi:hypothetical protein
MKGGSGLETIAFASRPAPPLAPDLPRIADARAVASGRRGSGIDGRKRPVAVHSRC